MQRTPKRLARLGVMGQGMDKQFSPQKPCRGEKLNEDSCYLH